MREAFWRNFWDCFEYAHTKEAKDTLYLGVEGGA